MLINSDPELEGRNRRWRSDVVRRSMGSKRDRGRGDLVRREECSGQHRYIMNGESGVLLASKTVSRDV